MVYSFEERKEKKKQLQWFSKSMEKKKKGGELDPVRLTVKGTKEGAAKCRPKRRSRCVPAAAERGEKGRGRLRMPFGERRLNRTRGGKRSGPHSSSRSKKGEGRKKVVTSEAISTRDLQGEEKKTKKGNYHFPPLLGEKKGEEGGVGPPLLVPVEKECKMKNGNPLYTNRRERERKGALVANSCREERKKKKSTCRLPQE